MIKYDVIEVGDVVKCDVILQRPRIWDDDDERVVNKNHYTLIMKREVLEALEQSVEWYRRGKTDISGENCPLCNVFRYTKRESVICHNCPIMKVSGCSASPWGKLSIHCSQTHSESSISHPTTCPTCRQLQDEEMYFLMSLHPLNKYEKKLKMKDKCNDKCEKCSRENKFMCYKPKEVIPENCINYTAPKQREYNMGNRFVDNTGIVIEIVNDGHKYRPLVVENCSLGFRFFITPNECAEFFMGRGYTPLIKCAECEGGFIAMAIIAGQVVPFKKFYKKCPACDGKGWKKETKDER